MEIKNSVVCIVDGSNKQGTYCGAGAVLIDPETGTILEEHSKYTGEGTNNHSEYKAVGFGLEKAEEYARQYGMTKILILSDSKLIVEQLNGVFKIKQAGLKPLHNEVKEELARLRDEGFEITLDQVSREYTHRADELASEEALKGSTKGTEEKYSFLQALKKKE